VRYLFALNGCLTKVKDLSNSWVGAPIDRFISASQRQGPDEYASRIGWKDRRYNLENGNWVYVHSMGDGCLVHFEVNPQGIIVSYKTEGDKCY